MVGRVVAQAVWPCLAILFVLASRDQPVIGLLGIAVTGFLCALLALGPDRLGRYFLIAALLATPINDRYMRPIPDGPITWSDLLLFVGFILLIPALTRRGVVLPLDWLIGAIVIVFLVLITALLAPSPLVAFSYGSRLIAAAVVLPLAFLLWRPDRRTIETMIWAYVIGQMTSVFYGLLEGYPRWDGLASHPNFFAMAGTTAGALLIHKWYTTTGIERLCVAGATAVCLAGVYFSGSRTALITIALVALIVPFVERTSAATATVAAVLFSGFLVLAWASQFAGSESALGRLMGAGSAGGSDNERRDALSLGVDRWMNSPIIGNAFDSTALDAHNIYLQVLVGIGVIGLVGFLLVLASACRPALTSHAMRRLSYPAFAFVITGMLTNSLWDRFIWAPLSLSILAAIPLPQGDQEPLASTPLPHDTKVTLT